MPVIVKIIGPAVGETPHDGRYLVAWDSDTPFGTVHCVSTDDIDAARRFSDIREPLEEWGARSKVEPNRPNDGRSNRPLTALTITFEDVKE